MKLFSMNKLLASDRSKWLFVIGLVAITGGYSYKVLSHSFGQSCKPQEIAHAYEPHSEENEFYKKKRPASQVNTGKPDKPNFR